MNDTMDLGQALIDPGSRAQAAEYEQEGNAKPERVPDAEMGAGQKPLYRHICTLLGAWAFFGLCYWILITLWGFHYHHYDQHLFVYTVCALGVAALAIMVVFAGISRGMEAGSARSRKWVTPYVVVCSVNLFVHTGFAQNQQEYLPYSVAFIACDFASMLYISFVFYGFGYADNRWFRVKNFVFEWFDLLSQVAVAIIYADFSNLSVDRTAHWELLFWIFILVQLTMWVIPIVFGAGLRSTRCLRHIFLLDIITDFPLLIINIASGAFEVQYWILIDLIVKIIFMIRGAYYAMTYFDELKLHRPWDLFIIFECCDNEE